MGKNPSQVGFEQPAHDQTAHSSSKHKSEVGFDQPGHGKGKTSSKKNSSEVGFAQTPKKGGKGKAHTKGAAPFDQPNHGGSAPMPRAEDKQGVVQAKAGGWKATEVAPKFTSVDSVMSYRKKKYGA